MSGWKRRDVSDLITLTDKMGDLDHRRQLIVLQLRSDGCPWSVIGDALGVSKQAAQQRFGSPTKSDA